MFGINNTIALNIVIMIYLPSTVTLLQYSVIKKDYFVMDDLPTLSAVVVQLEAD